LAYSTDLTDWEQTQQAIAALTADDHPPDILINAAGSALPGYCEDLPIEVFRNMMDTDFFGTLHPIKAILPAMMERCSGHIVNFSSMAGFLGVFGYTAYCAAKFAVCGFSEALRQEMKPYGIHVSVVYPPNTDTPGFHLENQYKPLETRRVEGTAKALTADKVAQAVVLGIERRQASILPSFDTWLGFQVSNGLTRVLYRYFDSVVAKSRRERLREEGEDKPK
jgi:3-dehydrosphinganine reductase